MCFSLNRLVNDEQPTTKHQMSDEVVFCWCIDLKREEDILASIQIEMKTKIFADIWCLVFDF